MGVPSFGVTKPLNTPVWQASKGDVTSASELARAADDAASKIYTTKRWSNRHKRGSEVYPDVPSFTLFVICVDFPLLSSTKISYYTVVLLDAHHNHGTSSQRGPLAQWYSCTPGLHLTDVPSRTSLKNQTGKRSSLADNQVISSQYAWAFHPFYVHPLLVTLT